ncbi:MAG: hypothetical protein QM760_21050 [Nibricoccus sp.]
MIAARQFRTLTSDYEPRTIAAMSTRPELARESLRQLVKHVFEQRGQPLTPITYGELSHRIARRPGGNDDGFGVGMGAILGVMGHMLEELSGKWGESIPHLQTLAVLKGGELKGLPDTGLDEFWRHYPSLSLVAKRRKVKAEYNKIADFGSRWEDVLKALALEPVAPAAKVVRRFGQGGESQEHRDLKEFVRQHPELVGADGKFQTVSEYALPSLDEIDVLFRSADTCIAVEVKSRISDHWPSDYERGLYQTVKYAALLAAMHAGGDPEGRPQVNAVLVLETTLPAAERKLAEKLRIRVVENVNPGSVVYPQNASRYEVPR